MEQTVSRFLKLLRIPVSEKYVQTLIQSHPDFPSLLTVSDTLQRLGINHAARRINKDNLIDLPYPYLLPLDKGRGDMVLIKNEADLGKHKSDLELWGGIVLQVEPTRQINDKINNELYAKESLIRNLVVGLVSLAVLFVLLPFAYSFSWLAAALLLTAIVGVTVGYFLLAKELGVTYQAIDALCSDNKGSSKTNNCDRVLKADINLLGVNFSDAAATYFIFQLVAISLPAMRETFLWILAVLSILTLPVILFSLYYQYAVVKTWCKLCLIVVGVLLVQFVVFSVAYLNGSIPLSSSLSFMNLAVLVLLFLTIGFSVILLKSIIERSNQLTQLAGNGNRVKHSVSVFTHLLKQQKKIDDTPFEKEMLLGNLYAPIKIIMVSNLYCNPCKLKHEIVDELVSAYPDKVSVALRFVRSGKDLNSISPMQYLLGYWLNNIVDTTDENEKTASLMHQWFTLWDMQKFMNALDARPL